MEKGFVYVARLIDYNNKFVGNYFKIGKTQQQQYKIRETQLNSTQLPIDVIFVRVFETDYMSSLENILHSCLVDYRCEKNYPNRKSITTEWFDELDEEDFHYRIDKVVSSFPNTKEINIVNEINRDNQTSTIEKQELIEAIETSNRKKLEVFWDNEDISEKFAYHTFINALIKISETIGPETLKENCWYFSDNEQKYIESFPKSYKTSFTRNVGEYTIFVATSNTTKARVINDLVKKYSLTQMRVVLSDLK
jgi:hypothetical protein